MTKYWPIANAVHISPTNGHGYDNVWTEGQYTVIYLGKCPPNTNSTKKNDTNNSHLREFFSIKLKGKW